MSRKDLPVEPAAEEPIGEEQEPDEAPAPADGGEDFAGSAGADESEPVETRVHPSAAVNETPVAPDGIVAEYYIGHWGPKPNYGCPYCPYSIIGMAANGEDGSGAVELHILSKIDSGDLAHRAALEPKE